MSKGICSEDLIDNLCYGTTVDETHKEDFCNMLFLYDAILDISVQVYKKLEVEFHSYYLFRFHRKFW